MTPEEAVFNSVTVTPRGTHVSDPNTYYKAIDDQERKRQRNIAKEYMKSLSLPNLFNAFGAAWKSLPQSITGITANPFIITGEAPAVGKISINPKLLASFNKTVYPRMFKSLSGDRYTKAVEAANLSIPKDYILYDGQIPGHPGANGTWNPNTHQISIVKGYENAIGHEARHALDNDWPLSLEERSILKNAYDDTFLEYGDSPSILTERVTTNYDIRDVLLKEAGLSESPIDVQNKYLESINANLLYNAMAKANDYSRAYLARMLKSRKYTDNNYEGYGKILKNIKRAMQVVGGISLPLFITDPQLFYKNEFGK